MIVVADTSPLNYLILIGQINVLQSLFRDVVIPPAVQAEMLRAGAPAAVRSWMESPPDWLEVRTPGRPPVSLDPELGDGEREAISLAYSGPPDTLLLIDERTGRSEAERLGIKVAGTLAVLLRAHHSGLLDFVTALSRLCETNFLASEELIKRFTDAL